MRTSDKKAEKLRTAVANAAVAAGLSEDAAKSVAEVAVTEYRTPLHPKRVVTTPAA
jgi:hypothetical protein